MTRIWQIATQDDFSCATGVQLHHCMAKCLMYVDKVWGGELFVYVIAVLCFSRSS